MSWLIAFLQLLFAPTRLAARGFKYLGWIEYLKGYLCWNAIFYVVLLTIYANFLIWQFKIPFMLLTYALVARINELVAAFYGDGVSQKRNPKITDVQRVALLSLAYLESACLFGALYFNIHLNKQCAFDPVLQGPFEALYLSVMTITTTGYGDFHPTIWESRLASMYEALVGIVFIALALAAYVGSRTTPSPSPPSATPH